MNTMFTDEELKQLILDMYARDADHRLPDPMRKLSEAQIRYLITSEGEHQIEVARALINSRTD